MRRTLMATTALLLSTATFAADAPGPLSVPLAQAPAGAYALEKTHASITFRVMHMGLAAYTMRFNDFDAQLQLNPAKPEASSVEVTIDPKSFDSNNPKMTAHATNADFLDVAKYPTITFKSTKIEKLSDNSGKIHGDLTLHGVTKPVVLNATFNGGGAHPFFKKHALGFSATTQFNRSDFGMSYGIPMVADAVNVQIEAEFVNADPATK